MKIKSPKEVLDYLKDLVAKEQEEKITLAEEKEEVVEKEEPVEEKVVEKVQEDETLYVSMAEFKSTVEEIKEMYMKVMQVLSPSEPDEVPEKLSADEPKEEVVEEPVEVKEEPKEEVKEIEVKEPIEVKEEKVEEIIHDPESVIEKKEFFTYSQNRARTTVDHVFDALWKNK